MPRFAELCIATKGRYEKVALVTDVREKDGFDSLLQTLDELKAMDCNCRILYMDADVRTLVRRYKESRRPHPLAVPGSTVEEAIKREIRLLAPVRERAEYIVSSTGLTLGMLQHRLFSLFAEKDRKRDIDITVMSFGYKYGIPMEADLVLDARFLPNPFYVEELRPLSGLDKGVSDYVFSFKQAEEFLQQLESMLDFLLPLYIEEGKVSLTVAVGCTGGRHRSVALAAALNQRLLARGRKAENVNRDIDK